MEGVKFDNGKSEWNLVPWDAFDDTVQVLAMGAKKYAPDNWKKVPFARIRYIAAAFRHLIARALGQLIDKESKLPHSAHAICCLLFLAWFDRQPRQKTQKVYISGPITGKYENNKIAFVHAEKALESRGYEVINPFDLSVVNTDKDWTEYMREDIKALCTCDYIYLLDGWEQSRGAMLEVTIAEQLGLVRMTSVDLES